MPNFDVSGCVAMICFSRTFGSRSPRPVHILASPIASVELALQYGRGRQFTDVQDPGFLRVN